MRNLSVAENEGGNERRGAQGLQVQTLLIPGRVPYKLRGKLEVACTGTP